MFQVMYEQTANWPDSGAFVVRTPPLEGLGAGCQIG